jgi:hypothetical protein
VQIQDPRDILGTVIADAGGGVLLVVVALYFLPTIIAAARKVPSVGSVVVINVLLGWTLIGWVVALAMAARSPAVRAADSVVETAPSPLGGASSTPAELYRECPFCKERMRRDASVCPHCRNQSEPWEFTDGVWWRNVDGRWSWLNETTGRWSAAKTPPDPATQV